MPKKPSKNKLIELASGIAEKELNTFSSEAQDPHLLSLISEVASLIEKKVGEDSEFSELLSQVKKLTSK